MERFSAAEKPSLAGIAEASKGRNRSGDMAAAKPKNLSLDLEEPQSGGRPRALTTESPTEATKR